MTKKVFFMPKYLRKGADTMVFVVKESEDDYYMGVYSEYDTILEVGTGEGKDYNRCRRTRISKNFYKEFLQEALVNKAKFS